MIIIIDGTGDYGRDSYAKAMAGGFCKKVQFLAGRPSQSSEKAKGAVLYHRGPGLAGTETYAIADEMLSKVPRRWDPKEDMYLVGHSESLTGMPHGLHQVGHTVYRVPGSREPPADPGKRPSHA